MMQLGMIGVGAGAAAALLFASVTSGSFMSILLFYLAPLPIMIAGLGWSHWAALVAAFTGAVALSVAFGFVFFFAFLAGAGLPAWWLVYLAMLARPGNASDGALEWYPPGRLVVWAAVLAAIVVAVAIPNFGIDAESFRATLQNALSRMLRPDAEGSVMSPERSANLARLVDFLVVAIPPAAAVLATVTNVVNLWLAGRVVGYSGRLTRPWPSLPDMEFPRSVAASLAIALALGFFGGMVGIAANVVAAALLMAYAVLGLAVLHAITRGVNSRPFILGGVYISVMVFGWPVLALCILGLLETAIELRARVARRRPPPAPPFNRI